MSTAIVKSPLVGGAGGNPYNFNCPQGSYITNIAGRSARWFDGARFICSDGTTSAWYGGTGGDPWDETSDAGFTGWVSARGANYVDQLTMKKKDGPGTPHGGDGGNPVAWTGCPSGSLITGARGSAQNYLDGLSFLCSPIAPPAPPPSIYSSGTVYNQMPPASSTYSPASPLSTPPAGYPAQSSTPSPVTYPAQQSVSPASYTSPSAGSSSNNMWMIIGFIFVVFTAVIVVILMSGSDTPAESQYATYAPEMYQQSQYAAPMYQQSPPQYVPEMYQYMPSQYASPVYQQAPPQ